MKDLFLGILNLGLLGWFIYFVINRIKTSGKPNPEVTKIHHENDSGYDIEYIDWQPKKNPRYAGNLFQLSWWWEATVKSMKDAHKIVRSKK